MGTQVGANSPLAPRNRIIVRGEPLEKEAIASAALSPGHFVERLTTDKDKIKKHATVGGNARPLLVAAELDFYGGGTGATLAINQAYATNDNVKLLALRSGDEVWARLADGEDITIGDLLQSDGAGALEIYAGDPAVDQDVDEGGSATYNIGVAVAHPLVRALQTVDNQAGGAEAWIRVEVL